MIHELRLSNVKNFRDATMEMGPVTVLVGANAAGKSNVRDALRFLHGVGRGYPLAEILEGKRGDGGETVWRGVRGGTSGLCFRGEDRVGLGVRMDLPIDASDSEAGDEAGRSPTLDYEVEMTSARSENLFAPLHLRAECLRRVGADGDDLVFDLPPQGAATIAGANGTRVEQEVERTEAVLSQLARAHAGSTPDVQPALDACRSAGAALRGMRFLDLDPRALRQRSPVGRTTLGDRGQNLASVLMDVCEDEDRKAEVVDWAAALTPMDVADLTFTVAEYSSEVTLVLVEANGMETPMQSASDGTLRFLGLLALLFQDDPPGLLFVEDVDTGLHAERLDLLADLLEARTREAGVQVVATTHSPHLLRALSDDARADARRIHRPGPGPAATIEPAGEGLDDWGTGGLGD